MEYKNYNIKIEQDELNESPREWDNLGTMVCVHSRYKLGDIQFRDGYEAQEHIKDQDIAVILPLYLYDHSGITMNTTGFSCPWDSGQVGYIYITKEKARKEYGWKNITAERKKKLAEYLTNEVKTYDQFLTGDVWGYSIEKDGEDVDSCWGFYGKEYCEEEAKSIVDWHIKDDLKKHGEQLKMELV